MGEAVSSPPNFSLIHMERWRATPRESGPKVRSRPISHLWIILGIDCCGPIGGVRSFVHAFHQMTNDPVLIAYAVKRAPSSGKPVWTRIGSAYPHDTGAGLTVVLDAMPFDGRVVLLERTDEDDDRLQRRLAQVARQV